jgi:hypothetical protein
MATQGMHWTNRSEEDFAHKISSDFVLQLEKKMEADHVSSAELAQSLGLSAGRVSQVLNDPGNLTLKNGVRFTHALGMKAALVAYDDGDPQNNNGPVNSEIFYRCWQRYGSPKDFFELAERSQAPAVVIHPQSFSTTYIMVFDPSAGQGETPPLVPSIETGFGFFCGRESTTAGQARIRSSGGG